MKNSTKSKRLKELLLPLFQEFQEREKKGWTENHTANQTAHTGMFHAQHDDWLRQQQTLSPQNTLHSRHNRYPEKIAVGCTSLEALGYVMQILRNGILQKALIYHRQGDSVEKT